MSESNSAVAQSALSSNLTTYDPKRWIVVGLLCLGIIIAFISRTNLSSALAYAPFVKAFQLSNIHRGALNSAFFWSYAALQIPAGLLVDRYGVKKTYAISFVLWCLASAATGLTHTFPTLIMTRVLAGIQLQQLDHDDGRFWSGRRYR